MESESTRRRRVEWGLAAARNTLGEPSAYECDLLDKYVCGALTLEEVIILVEMKQAEGKRT
jgi:hypothetical protein